MSSTFTLTVNTSDNANDTSGLVPVALTSPELYIKKIWKYFLGISNGTRWAGITVTNNAVAAAGTITFSSIADGDTATVNGRVYTAKTSGATGLQQFNIGASDTAAATNFAAKLNADTSTLVAGVVSGAAVGAVTTVTSIIPGNIGNLSTLAISAHGSVSAATLVGGTQGTSGTVHQGL